MFTDFAGVTGAGVVALDSCVVRAADEGVPIAALARIFKPLLSLDLRSLLHAAVASGRLIEMPREDWPPLVPRALRAPQVQQHAPGDDDRDLMLKIARALKTTRLESRIMLVILRRGQAHREQLHEVVEQNRGNPVDATGEKIIDVIICKLRKKLTPLGLTLNTVHSQGYEMADEDRKKAWRLINGET